MRKRLFRYLSGFLLLALLLGHAARQFTIPFIDSLDNVIYDVKLNLTMPNTVDERIAILDIDEKSLAELGRWPWSRDRMADIVNALFEHYRVRLLGFDLVMAEPDASSGLQVLDGLGAREFRNDPQFRQAIDRIRPQLDFDKRFADSLRNRPTILGYYFANGGTSNGMLPSPAIPERMLEGRSSRVYTWNSFGANLPSFQKASAGAGHFNPVIDSDGSVRRVPLLVRHDGKFYESFSLAIVRKLLDAPVLMAGAGEAADAGNAGYGAIEWLQFVTASGAVSRIPVDEHASALIPFRGRQGSYPYHSLADVLAKRIPVDKLAGKVVIVGTTAPGLRDFRETPVGEVYPGMEVHANLISGMLDGTIKERPQYTNAIEFLLLLATGAIMIFLFPWRSPLRATLATALVLAGAVGINMAAWEHANAVLPLASGLMLIVTLFVLNMSYGYFVESKAKRQITERFGQYVPPELVVKMSKDPASYSMQSRKKELTVLFSDVRGFTTISEGMEPEDLAHLMNEYLTAMTLVIRKHHGTLDKYIGDAIVAFWGAPIDDAEHARHGVLAALEMQRALIELNARLMAKGWPEIKIGIGLNTGNMTVGDMGSSIRLAYTVMGDAVNLGARLESKTKEYGVGIMVGEATCEAVKDVVFRELDRVQVKGKEEPVTIFEPIALDGTLDATTLEELALWQQALDFYRRQDWMHAQTMLAQLKLLRPGFRLYELYEERIAAFRNEPPSPDWAGVTRFDTK